MEPKDTHQPGERRESPRPLPTRRIVVSDRPVGHRAPSGEAPSIRLGTVSRTQADAAPGAISEAERARKRGWRLGSDEPREKKPEAKTVSARTLIIVLAAVAAAFVLLVMLFGSTRERGVLLTDAEKKMLNDYRGYLARNGYQEAKIKTRLGEVEQRIEVAKWSQTVGADRRADDEFKVLLLLDNDRQSPLYAYCVDQLKK